MYMHNLIDWKKFYEMGNLNFKYQSFNLVAGRETQIIEGNLTFQRVTQKMRRFIKRSLPSKWEALLFF